jgi:hypothetical protein
MVDDTLSAQALAVKAWDAWLGGHDDTATGLAHAAWAAVEHHPRRERQQVQVVRLAVCGDPDRGRALAAEHLAEFPEDELVRAVFGTSRGA